jgi:hypothetical protein
MILMHNKAIEEVLKELNTSPFRVFLGFLQDGALGRGTFAVYPDNARGCLFSYRAQKVGRVAL